MRNYRPKKPIRITKTLSKYEKTFYQQVWKEREKLVNKQNNSSTVPKKIT